MHVACAHDLDLARVGFYTQSAVGFKPARRAVELLCAGLDAHMFAVSIRRSGAPWVDDRYGAVRLVQLGVAASKVAHKGRQYDFAVGCAARRGDDGRGACAEVGQDSLVCEIDADADDAGAAPFGVADFREDAAEFAPRRKQIIGPLDVGRERAAFGERGADGERGGEREERPKLRVESRAQEEAEVEARVLWRDPSARVAAAPGGLFACDNAETRLRAADGSTQRFCVGRRE